MASEGTPTKKLLAETRRLLDEVSSEETTAGEPDKTKDTAVTETPSTCKYRKCVEAKSKGSTEQKPKGENQDTSKSSKQGDSKPKPADIKSDTSSRTASSRIDDEPYIRASRFTVEELDRVHAIRKALKKDGDLEKWVVV